MGYSAGEHDSVDEVVDLVQGVGREWAQLGHDEDQKVIPRLPGCTLLFVGLFLHPSIIGELGRWAAAFGQWRLLELTCFSFPPASCICHLDPITQTSQLVQWFLGVVVWGAVYSGVWFTGGSLSAT